jgi:two-component system sensor histidine kinase RegB
MNLNDQYPLESAIHHNLYRLGLIRAVVIFGQCLALIYFTAIKPLGLASAEIAWVLAIYASISVATANRGRFKIPITNKEFFIHLLVDIIFFSILLYFSGGASNPFISYYLIPISIAAITLPRSYTASIALIALSGYSLLLIHYIPVMAIAPSHMGHAMAGNNLHILGMWANFAISAAIISYFVSQIATELESQQKKIAEHREQQLENEQLLAIGTLAAGTAHELGTPLNTMRLLVDEMQLQQTTNKDINLLSQQIDQCKITLRQLQSTANESSANQYTNQNLHSYFDQLIKRWQLMRPELNATISYAKSGLQAPVIRFHPTIAQSILNLLNNAADASPSEVEVNISWSESEVIICIKDFGEGFETSENNNEDQPFLSSKTGGLGLGLFLSQNTVTRFGGSISLDKLPEGGTLTKLCLPLNLTKNTKAVH